MGERAARFPRPGSDRNQCRRGDLVVVAATDGAKVGGFERSVSQTSLVEPPSASQSPPGNAVRRRASEHRLDRASPPRADPSSSSPRKE